MSRFPFSTDTRPTATYTLSLHDALPIFVRPLAMTRRKPAELRRERRRISRSCPERLIPDLDRKSTRLNSSHMSISYAVFCLKKKKSGVGLAQPLQLAAHCREDAWMLVAA